MKHEKLQEGGFQVEIYMSFSSTHWCRLTPSAEHRSTPPAEFVDSRQTTSVDRWYADVDQHPSAPMMYRVQLLSIDRHRLYVDQHPPQTEATPTVDINKQPDFG